MTKPHALVCALACVCLSVACQSRESQIREAEARAKRFGIPAPRIVHDVVYAEYGDRQLTLDLYVPSESGQLTPGLVVVRGGAWLKGDKTFFSYIAGQLAAEGFASASIEYRTSDEATFPAAVHNVKAAVRWMRAHASEYGINPGAIGAIGGSAGAHLVAMLATSGGMKELEGNGGNAETPSDVQAVVAMGGGYDLSQRDVGPRFIEAVSGFVGGSRDTQAEVVAAASPIMYVNGRSAPLLLMHSPTDPDVPFSQASEMEKRYRNTGAHVVLKKIDAPGIHGFWGDPLYWPDAKRQAVLFFRRTLKVNAPPEGSPAARAACDAAHAMAAKTPGVSINRRTGPFRNETFPQPVPGCGVGISGSFVQAKAGGDATVRLRQGFDAAGWTEMDAYRSDAKDGTTFAFLKNDVSCFGRGGWNGGDGGRESPAEDWYQVEVFCASPPFPAKPPGR